MWNRNTVFKACLVLLVVCSVGAKVILTESERDELTRPTFIDRSVLKMLPDKLAARLVVKDKDEWTVKGSVADSFGEPQPAKLRFREMQQIKVKEHEKMPTPIVHKVEPKAEEKDPLSSEPRHASVAAQQDNAAREEVSTQQEEQKHQAAPDMDFREQMRTEMESKLQAQASMEQQQQQPNAMYSNPGQVYASQQNMYAQQVPGMYGMPNPGADLSVNAQAADVSGQDDLDKTPAQIWADAQQMRFKQTQQQAVDVVESERARYGYHAPATANAAEQMRFREAATLPTNIIDARVARARQRRQANGRAFRIDAGPPPNFVEKQSFDTPYSSEFQIPSQPPLQANSIAQAPTTGSMMLETQAEVHPHIYQKPEDRQRTRQESESDQNQEHEDAFGSKAQGMRFRESFASSDKNAHIPEAPPMELPPSDPEQNRRQQQSNGIPTSRYEAPRIHIY